MCPGENRRGNYKMVESYTSEGIPVQVGSDWKQYALRVLAVILIVFIMAELAFYVIVVPLTSRVDISITGTRNVGVDELCSLAGIAGNERWISFDTALVASRLASCPLFESVIVEKKFPDKVAITLVERKPVALAFGVLKGRTVPVEIDRNGIAFRVGSKLADTNLPLLTGLEFNEPIAGMRLNAQLKPLMKDIADIEMKNPALLASISEIGIVQKTYGGYDLMLYPVHVPVRVKTDRALNEDALQYMMLVLDVVEDMALDIDEIDIRAGTVAYHVKGELL
jgi:cell division protein FtsQ